MSFRIEGYVNLCFDIYRVDEYGFYEDIEFGYCVDWIFLYFRGVIN